MDLSQSPFLQQAAAFAMRLADAARPLALGYFRQALAIEIKPDQSPVTAADRAVEGEMRRLIKEQFPSHGVLGEEYGKSAGSEFTWVLDPIDGTKSYLCGLPLFGTLIALLHGQQPVLGIIDMPAMDERWTGMLGAASSLNSAPARVSACERIEQARVFTTSPDMFATEDWQRFNALSRRAAIRRYGGDCYSYGLLASGHCDLIVETGLQPYDFMALLPVIEGAGGKISDWQGNALNLQSDGHVIAAASPRLWVQAIDALER